MENVVIEPNSRKATLIHQQGDKLKLVKSMDTSTNNVLLGNSDIFDNAGTDHSTLRPLGTVVLTGEKDTYAKVPGNTAVQLEIMEALQSTPAPSDEALQLVASGLMLDTTGHTINTTLGIPAQTSDIGILGGQVNNLHLAGHTIANEISITGAPGIKFKTAIASSSGTPIPAGGGIVTLANNITVTQPAFEIAFNVAYTSTSGAVPFVNLICTWTTASGLFVANKNYFVPIAASGSGGMSVYVVGPALGDVLTVSVVSKEPPITGQPATCSFEINAISHYINSDYFGSAQVTAIPTFTASGGLIQSGVVFATNPTIPASGTTTRLMMPTNAECQILIDVGTVAGSIVKVTITDPAVPSGNSLYGLNAGTEFYSNAAGVSAQVREYFQMPNGPALVTMVNQNAGAAVSPIITITESRKAAA